MGGNGSGEKFQKIELNSEIWGEWVVTYGGNGYIFEKNLVSGDEGADGEAERCTARGGERERAHE